MYKHHEIVPDYNLSITVISTHFPGLIKIPDPLIQISHCVKIHVGLQQAAVNKLGDIVLPEHMDTINQDLQS